MQLAVLYGHARHRLQENKRRLFLRRKKHPRRLTLVCIISFFSSSPIKRTLIFPSFSPILIDELGRQRKRKKYESSSSDEESSEDDSSDDSSDAESSDDASDSSSEGGRRHKRRRHKDDRSSRKKRRRSDNKKRKSHKSDKKAKEEYTEPQEEVDEDDDSLWVEKKAEVPAFVGPVPLPKVEVQGKWNIS